MRKTINLTSKSKRKESVLKKVQYVTVGLFFLMVVSSLGLITYRLVLRSAFEALDVQEQQLNTQLLSQVEKKDKILETKSRLSEIRKVISTRAPMTTRMETISSIVPVATQVNSISGTDTEIQMSLESEQLSSLNTLLEKEIAEVAKDKKRGIKKIEMKSFGINPKTSRYFVSLSIQFI